MSEDVSNNPMKMTSSSRDGLPNTTDNVNNGILNQTNDSYNGGGDEQSNRMGPAEHYFADGQQNEVVMEEGMEEDETPIEAAL